MKFMFSNCKSLKTIDLSSFKINNEIIDLRDSVLGFLKILSPNCTNMSFMFEGCEKLTKIIINRKASEFLEKQKKKEIFPNIDILEVK